MLTPQCLAEEAARDAKKLGMPPDEYVNACQAIMETFLKTAPDMLQNMLSDHGSVREKNEKFEKKVAMGARKTHGSF